MRGPVGVLVPVLVAASAPELAAADDAPPVQSLAVGDFDGDGKPDVAVGLPDQSAGKFKKAGVVRMYSGATGAFVRQLSGTAADQAYGTSIAAVGDSDGDGATDLAINAPFAEKSFIEFVSGKTGKRIFLFSGRAAVAWADWLCPLGDGSGKTRVDIAMRWASKNEWRYVYSDKEAIGMAVKDPGGYMCSSVAIGDVNKDGTPDFAIGDWAESPSGKKAAGLIRVVSGHYLSQGKGDMDLLIIPGTHEGERLGLTIAPAGDWNGDGVPDVLAGVAGDSAKKDSSWVVRVFSGKDGAELWKAVGTAGDVSMGGVAMIGDVDGDGKPDVVVGTPATAARNGAVTALAAKDGAVLWSVKGAAKENLGEGLYPCADCDGDGVADVVVLAPGAAVKGTKGLGYVRFLSGKTGVALVQINPLATK
jgi:hypothetical protein